MIYTSSGRSIPQRLLVEVLQTALVAAGIWLTLHGDGDPTRRALLVAAMVIVHLRMTLTMFVFLRRAIGWEEALSVPMAFAIYFLGFALLGRGESASVGALGYAGVALFVIGSATNTLSEWLRHLWKRDPAHQGKLYTGGLFRYAVHVNYFGDVLWVLGLACIAANPWGFAIPVALFCFFAFYNAPMLDRHLEERYGDAFRSYREETAWLVPFVF